VRGIQVQLWPDLPNPLRRHRGHAPVPGGSDPATPPSPAGPARPCPRPRRVRVAKAGIVITPARPVGGSGNGRSHLAQTLPSPPLTARCLSRRPGAEADRAHPVRAPRQKPPRARPFDCSGAGSRSGTSSKSVVHVPPRSGTSSKSVAHVPPRPGTSSTSVVLVSTLVVPLSGSPDAATHQGSTGALAATG
jgi:hypothetical protein